MWGWGLGCRDTLLGPEVTRAGCVGVPWRGARGLLGLCLVVLRVVRGSCSAGGLLSLVGVGAGVWVRVGVA